MVSVKRYVCSLREMLLYSKTDETAIAASGQHGEAGDVNGRKDGDGVSHVLLVR